MPTTATWCLAVAVAFAYGGSVEGKAALAILVIFAGSWWDHTDRFAAVRAQRHANVWATAVANHKGGVGKTTVLYHLIKRLAEDNPTKRVLVVDCSLYGDLTKKLAGPDADLSRLEDATVDAMADEALRRPTGVERVASLWSAAPAGSVTIDNHVLNVHDKLCQHAPANLWLVTSRRGLVAQGGSGYNGDGLRGATGDETTRVCAAFRAALAREAQDCLVLFDTDGGEDHELTRFALGAADAVVVPLRTDLDALPRLTRMFAFMEGLAEAGHSTAVISQAFFNQVVVGNESEATARAPFTPRSAATTENMESIVTFFEAAAQRFPAILHAVSSRRTDVAGDTFFTSVRAGGARFARADGESNPYAVDARVAGINTDLDALAARLFTGTDPGQ